MIYSMYRPIQKNVKFPMNSMVQDLNWISFNFRTSISSKPNPIALRANYL